MKKRIMALILGLMLAVPSVAVPVNAEETTDVVIAEAFPDEEMQLCVKEALDKDSDGVLNAEEIAAATELVVDSWYYYPEDLKGIEYLTELKSLNINSCWDITELDVTKNTKLEELDISVTDIAEVDLSKCPELKVFKAQDVRFMTSLDLSKNTKLEELNIVQTPITSLDLSNLTELKILKADCSKLTALDVTKNVKLETLKLIGVAGVTALDLSANTALTDLDISGSGIKALNLSNNTALKELRNYDRNDVYWKTFKAAPVEGLDLSANTALTKVILDGTDLSHLDVLDLSNHSSLIYLDLEKTGLKGIAFNDNVEYTNVYLTDNAFATLKMPAKLAEGAKFEAFTQNAVAKVASNDPIETFDLGSFAGIDKVSVVDTADYTYNAETGIVTFTGDSKVFKYRYNFDISYGMDVTLTVVNKTLEEEKAEADAVAAAPVMKAIDEIGEVTLGSEEAIAAARAAYEALTEDQKELVENYEKLEEAIATFEALKTEAANKAAAAPVMKAIDEIGEVTLESEEAIAAARAAYEALTEDQKTLVENYAVLEEAEDILALFKGVAYVDVKDGDWFYDAVMFNYRYGIMTGLDKEHFGPAETLSRAQFAVILYRMEGEPEFTTEKSLKDIKGDEWYGPAVLWAAENGIVKGYENGCFGPADNITREQMAVLMYRYAEYLELDTSKTADISKFVDGAKVSGFAKDAMSWANGQGIITGKDEGTRLDPQGNAARAEAATIIQRMVTAYAE